MARPRFFLVSELGDGVSQVAPLADDDVHHIADVLRIRPGEEIVLVEPDRSAWIAVVVAAAKDGIRVRTVHREPCSWEPSVTVVIGVAKGGKVDEAVQGAVEVGVEAVWTIALKRDVVKLDAQKRARRVERWNRVASAAAKQSQRTLVPRVSEPGTMAELLPALSGFDLVLVAWEEERSRSIREAITHAVLGPESRVAVVVGSEGGMTAEEVAALESVGAIPVTLGPTILRAETAGVVAPALVIAELRERHAASSKDER